MSIKKILLLGATGSIGTQTIELVHELSASFSVVAVALHRETEVLEKFLPLLPDLKEVGIADVTAGKAFKEKHPELKVLTGEDVCLRMAEEGNYDKAVNALVGAAGFLPSLEVLRKGKDLCLANKESLVIGGKLIKAELAKGHGRLFAIDSEHVALAKLLKNADRSEIKRMIITASGGSLRDTPTEQFKDVSLETVLHHPTWKMGVRITVDSATMVNKGFEFIEASYLYDWDINNISVLINDESEIHSALEFKDHSYLFEVGPSDMKVPISYALNEGHRIEASFKSVDFDRKCSLNFRRFDEERYPLFRLVLNTYAKGGTAMAFLNAVDEEAIKRFASGKLNYLQMIGYIKNTVEKHLISYAEVTPDSLMKTDAEARKLVAEDLD
jgi:1-deoxy-D-xylulose-5-phosphate reductoisomerase